jgi:hypothetical protein
MRNLLAATAAIALAAGMAPPAHAILQITAAVDGVQVFTCSDNAACDQNLALGTLQLANGVFSGIAINGSISTSTAGPPGILNTSSLSIINTTGVIHNIEAAVGATGFIGPVSSFATSTSGVWQTAAGSTILSDFFNDPLNVQGADTATDTPGTQIDTFSDTAVGLADAYSHNASGVVIDPSLYSMTQHFDLDLVAGGQLVNRGGTEIKSAAVNEPGSTLGMLGIGLIGAGIVARRRNKKPANAGPYAIA